MAAPVPRRRVATVLFIDIVGSTALATELGDAHWRMVLARFRQVVRRELKRCRGREQDTAGDSFYATFAEPAQALRAAATLSAAVQEIGLDVRAGLHTGECEEIDGKLTGIAVHIGARVMALAGAAEVLATRTTRDLVVGSGAGFEEAGTHELKGVEGEWLLYRLVSIEERLPPPLEPAVAAQRLARSSGQAAGGADGRSSWQRLPSSPRLRPAVRSGRSAAAPAVVPQACSGSTRRTGRVISTVRDIRSAVAAAPTCGPSTERSGSAAAATAGRSRSARSPAAPFAARSACPPTRPTSRSGRGRSGSPGTPSCSAGRTPASGSRRSIASTS